MVISLNLGPETAFPDRDISWFSWVPPSQSSFQSMVMTQLVLFTKYC